MPLPDLQSLPPDRKKVVFIATAGVCLLGLIALFAGLFFSSPETEKSLTTNLNEPSSTQQNPSTITPSTTNEPTKTNNAFLDDSGSPYPTPYPTENQTLNYFISAIPTTKPPTPTATPLPGKFYLPNGQKNDLTIRLIRVPDWSIFVQVQLINTKTKEIRVIGRGFNGSPGDSVFFTKDFSSVIFVGGKPTEDNTEKISFYSIPQNKITKQISLADIKKAIPSLKIEESAILSSMVPSPNQQKIALSYGKSFYGTPIDPTTNIIVIDLTTNKMSVLSAKGLVSSWKDDSTIIYQPATGATQEITL